MRKFLFLGLIALGFSLPMLTSKIEDKSPSAVSAFGASAPADYASSLTLPPLVVSANQATSGPAGSPWQFASATGNSPPMVQAQPPVYNAFLNPSQFLNFEITPDWVRGRWPRVSISSGEDELTGMRVALVSGPRPVDIHGSLTYYFDSSQNLQRICFRGWTGEPSELIGVLSGRYRFSQVKSGAAGYYQTTSWGIPKGFLRLDYPAVIRNDAPTEQLMVLLEIINPASSLTVSQQNLRTLAALGG